MIHQVCSGGRQVTEILIEAEQSPRVKSRLNKVLAINTGHSVEDIDHDTDQKNWMFAEETLEYGLIDHTIS